MARDHTLKQAAEVLDVSVRTLRRYVKDGGPHDRGPKPRRPYLVDPEELRAYIAATKAAKRGEASPRSDPTVPPTPTLAGPPLDTPSASPPTTSPGSPAGATRRPRKRPTRATLERQLRASAVGEAVDQGSPWSLPPDGVSDAVRSAYTAITARPVTPSARALLRRLELGDVLLHAQSVHVLRVPTSDIRLRLSSYAGRENDLVVSRGDLRAAAQRGGLIPLIDKRLGLGRYRVAWIGACGEELHSELREIPDLKRLAKESERAEFARQRASRADPDEAAKETHKASLASWTRLWTTAAMTESAQRRHWLHGLHLSAVSAKEPQRDRVSVLERLCLTDLRETRAAVQAFLSAHAEELFLASPWVVTETLDHVLVPVPDPRFCPWTGIERSLTGGGGVPARPPTAPLRRSPAQAATRGEAHVPTTRGLASLGRVKPSRCAAAEGASTSVIRESEVALRDYESATP
jgi:hypothetical protein